MKTKTLIKLLITFSALIAVSFGIAIACAGDDGDWFGYSDFAPENFADKSYTPLFYAPYDMFYEIGYDYNHINRFRDEIMEDWKNYLKDNLSEKYISYFLYDKKSESVVSGLYGYVSKNEKGNVYHAWSTKINLNSKEVKGFLEFLYYAKEIEKSSVNEFDYWDYENKEESPLVDETTINKLKGRYNAISDPFLKNRYWFQILKAYFYSKTKSEAIAFFEETKNEVPKNTLYYRALSYIAGINYRSGNYAQSNYLFSQVFDNCPSMRTTAAYNFHPQNETDWNQALNLAKNANEKAALWALLGYYVDEGRAIKEIYKLNPKNPHLDYLLTRLINKTEQSIACLNIESASKYNNEISDKINKNDVETVYEIAKSENTLKPYFWNLAAAYLQTLNSNFKQADTFLNRAGELLPEGRQFKDQFRLLKLVNNLSKTTRLDKITENELFAELNWLYKELPKSAAEKFRYSKASSWSKLYIAAIYKSQNNIVLAQLFNPRQEFYHNQSNLEAIQSFLEKGAKSPFEQLAAEIYPISIYDIYEYQAVLSTFDNKIDQAYKYMKKADGRREKLLKANPFNGFIVDCHDCEHIAPQKTKFSKLRFIEILQIMQNKVKNGEDLYNNYLLLGNSFYNITFYGNARVFYEGAIIGADMGTPWSVDDYYEKILFNMSNASYYYQKAFDAATTNEQKAKCSYMLAKCERNEYYNGNNITGNEWEENTHPDFIAWDGFKKLKNQYSSTKYYNEVIKECGYFAKYIEN